MLGNLNRTLLDFLSQRTAGSQLSARGQLHIHLTVGHVLDIFLEIQLHDRITAGCTNDVGRSKGHGVFRILSALFFFFRGLSHCISGHQ